MSELLAANPPAVRRTQMDLLMPITLTIRTPPEWDEHRWAAEMTDRQFRALAQRAAARDLEELKMSRRVVRARTSDALDHNVMRRLLSNSWNTEHILSLTSSVIESASGAALQWTFPQAYYAAYSSTLAFFQVAGFSETGHAPVQKRFTQLALGGHYPSSMNFGLSGTMRNSVFHSLDAGDLDRSSVHYDPTDPHSIDKHIMQYLRSTRKKRLEVKKDHLNLRTRAGKPRKSFREPHWEVAARSLGATGLLCLLYRKRIKSNYQDIDTFTESDLDPSGIFEALTNIVNEVSLVHETFIAAALGVRRYREIAERFLRKTKSHALERRISIIGEIVE